MPLIEGTRVYAAICWGCMGLCSDSSLFQGRGASEESVRCPALRELPIVERLKLPVCGQPGETSLGGSQGWARCRVWGSQMSQMGMSGTRAGHSHLASHTLLTSLPGPLWLRWPHRPGPHISWEQVTTCLPMAVSVVPMDPSFSVENTANSWRFYVSLFLRVSFYYMNSGLQKRQWVNELINFL